MEHEKSFKANGGMPFIHSSLRESQHGLAHVFPANVFNYTQFFFVDVGTATT